MTGEEMERAIEFLLRNQAKHDAQIAELRESITELRESITELRGQVAETNRIVQLNSETQTEFIRFETAHLEAQREINESLRAGIRELAAGQKRTDSRIDRLADTVEKFISGRGSNNGEDGGR